MKTVLIAGATGYLGRHITQYYLSEGWRVRALVRNADSARDSDLQATELFEGEATVPSTLRGAMQGVNVVVSALGITRQRDGLSYQDVDYQANANLLEDAMVANVPHFAYVHVLNADAMAGVPLVDAKAAFSRRLNAAPIRSTIICPSGYFSDMADFYSMAKSGRVWLFGRGQHKMNPIDGADLAAAIADAIANKREFVTVGGPQILSHLEIAELAFATLKIPVSIRSLNHVLAPSRHTKKTYNQGISPVIRLPSTCPRTV